MAVHPSYNPLSFSDEDLYGFGPVYDANMSRLIGKHLELDTNDRLCYVGDCRGTLVPMLKETFCLTEPVAEVALGNAIGKTESAEKSRPTFSERLVDDTADDFFHRESLVPAHYDKILLRDALPFFSDFAGTMERIAKTLKDHGRILIIHRPAHMNTLPLFTSARQRLVERDVPLEKILSSIQSLGLDVHWDLESLTTVTPKRKWIAMLRNRYPSPLEVATDVEIRAGIRELADGVFRYAGDDVEFTDRLLFVAASRNVLTPYPEIYRCNGWQRPEYKRRKHFLDVEITPEIEGYLGNRKELDPAHWRGSLF